MDHLTTRLINARIAHPDKRTRLYKEAERDAYLETITELSEKIKRIKCNKNEEINCLKSRIALKCDVDEALPTCSICMEDMCGKVTLKCGHEMCPDCFAQHSRVNNTCPFCREEFAPKPKRQVKMPLYQLNSVAEMWARNAENYFKRQRIRLMGMSNNQVERHLTWLVTANSKILMEHVKNWYDKDIA